MNSSDLQRAAWFQLEPVNYKSDWIGLNIESEQKFKAFWTSNDMAEWFGRKT